MSILKKIIFTLCFVLVTLVLPLVTMFFFVDGTNGFSIYVTVFGIILFSIFGYIVVSMKALSQDINNALEEMKKQNAAIAYKLTHADEIISNASDKTPDDDKKTTKTDGVADDSETKKGKVNLNPADPLDFD